jgi:type VI protein secretion system component VasF
MSVDENSPDPESNLHALSQAFLRGLSENELLAYRDEHGELSREWGIARDELKRRSPGHKIRLWFALAAWAIVVVYLFHRWR